MAGSLGAFLAEQRGAREEAKADSWDRLWKAGMVAGPVMIIFLIAAPIEFSPKLWICGLASAFIAVWIYKPIAAAKRRVKVGINEGIADAMGLTYAHDGEQGREYELAKRYGLLPSCDKSELEDFWSGSLGEHGFHLHEAHLQERRGSGKNRRLVTVFRGAILRIGSSRRFHGTTLVQRSGKHKKWTGGRKDSVKFGGHQLDVVDMVHPDFDDTFEVWSDDQVEARYLVNPLYVERLIQIEQAFAGKDIRSLFTGGDIIIAVGSGNLFEGGTMNPESDRFMVEQCAKQFASLAKLAQTVNETREVGS